MNAVIDPNSFRSTAAASLDADKARGNMDEILKRLGILETTLTDVRLQLASVLALLPTFATKADLTNVEKKADAIAAVLPHLATKAELEGVRTDVQTVRTDLQTQVSVLIKWIVGTGLGAAGVAAAVATVISRLMG